MELFFDTPYGDEPTMSDLAMVLDIEPMVPPAPRLVVLPAPRSIPAWLGF